MVNLIVTSRTCLLRNYHIIHVYYKTVYIAAILTINISPVFNAKSSITWREQVTLAWVDHWFCFTLDKNDWSNFYGAYGSLKQHSMGRNDAQFGHIVLSPSQLLLMFKWPRICYICLKHFTVISAFMTYHNMCNYSNTTGGTSGAVTANFSKHLSSTSAVSGVRVSLVFCVVFCISLFVLLSFSFWPLCCLSFDFSWWLPIWYLQSLLKQQMLIS